MYILYSVLVNPSELYNVTMSLIEKVDNVENKDIVKKEEMYWYQTWQFKMLVIIVVGYKLYNYFNSQ
jgi:hypothetical protein